MEEARSTIPARPDEIRAALLDVLALPQWNEAFVSLEGPPVPAVGTSYDLQVRPGLRGQLEYAAIEPGRIEIRWQVPGFRETGVWTIDESGLVTHTFTQTGPLAALLKSAYRGIAKVRLERLAARLHQLARTP